MKYVLREINDKICILTINRPKQLNALNGELIAELNNNISWIQDQKSIRVVILTGSGDKAFIAGADIAEMSSMSSEDALHFSKLGQELTLKIENLQIPVIAAINGFALGGGCEFALSCHIRLASENAIFGQPEDGMGLIAGFGGTQRLSRLIGKGLAVELLITGKHINAIRFFKPVINKGDIFVLKVLKIITAILQSKAAVKAAISPKYNIS